MQKFKTALFGTGFVGRVHLEAIRRLGYVEIYAIGEPQIEKANQLAAEFGVSRTEADYHRILEDPAVDAVHICTPNALHFPMAKDALLAVTGDHGMVTLDRRVDIDTTPDLTRGVALVGGDPRARLVYARRGAADDVLATWRGVIGDDALVLPAAQAVAEGWFGPVSARVARRIGDVVAVPRGGFALVRTKIEPGLSALPGQHGGLTADEQWVPLLLAHNP